MSSFNDIQPPKCNPQLGAIHPINQVKDFLIDLLQDYGFTAVDGPEIESEEFNFDMLNIKKTHPARQMHDTFYVNNKTKVLRTHTSPVQIRSMLVSKPPLAITSAGKVFRKDDDATHLPMFHQVEGMYIDEQVTFSQLKDLIHKIIYATGPERIAPAWWQAPAGSRTRDYFRLRDDQGAGFWLYREGLPERHETPSWFLHGFFA